MKTHQCPTEQVLNGFGLGNLAGERYEEVSLHLESCTECACRFETLHTLADGLIEHLRQELPSQALEEDSEARRLMDAAAAIENTSLAANADTQPSRKAARPSHSKLTGKGSRRGLAGELATTATLIRLCW